MSTNDWIAAVTIGVIVLLVGGLLWWFVLRGRPDTELEHEESQTWVETAGGDRCLTCGHVIEWEPLGDGWTGFCECPDLSEACGFGDHKCCGFEEDCGCKCHSADAWQEPDELWVEQLPEVLEFPPIHEHREMVPSSLYADLSDDPDLNRWDLEQQRGRIADIRTQLAMLGAREATWYADRMASVGERLAA